MRFFEVREKFVNAHEKFVDVRKVRGKFVEVRESSSGAVWSRLGLSGA